MRTLRGRDDGIRLEQIPRNNSQDHRTTSQGEGSTQFYQRCPEDDWDKKEGWAAVGAGSAIFFVYLGLIYSYGIVQLHLTESRLASVSTLSFIGSVAAAICPLTGMIVARIIGRIGYRATAFTGSVLLGLGEFTAGWSTKSVPAMFVTQGILFGVGASLLFWVSILLFSITILL